MRGEALLDDVACANEAQQAIATIAAAQLTHQKAVVAGGLALHTGASRALPSA